MPGVLILPQRQTVLVAKQAAEVDLLTGGRFRLGVGIGWNDVEYEALGKDFHNRGRRATRSRSSFCAGCGPSSGHVHRRFHTIDRRRAQPMPVQRPIPIWMGGGTAPAVLDRIGRLADGWLANTPPGHGLEEAWEVVQAAAAAAGRPADAIGLQGLVEPRAADDVDAALL